MEIGKSCIWLNLENMVGVARWSIWFQKLLHKLRCMWWGIIMQKTNMSKSWIRALFKIIFLKPFSLPELKDQMSYCNGSRSVISHASCIIFKHFNFLLWNCLSKFDETMVIMPGLRPFRFVPEIYISYFI